MHSSAARMTSVNVPERMNELTDGTVCSVDAATEAGIGPYRESRVFRLYEREALPKLEGARRGKEAA